MIRSFTLDLLARPILYATLAIGLSWGQLANAADIRLKVVDENDVEVAPPYRFLVEQDMTYDPGKKPAGQQWVEDFDSLSFNFHPSHNPVLASGDVTAVDTDGFATITVPDVPGGNGYYFVSVLAEGHTLGGGSVSVTAATPTLTVPVHTLPIKTAQISIKVFADISPVNGALDVDEYPLSTANIINEDGLPQEMPFRIVVEDAAGQYGAAAGHTVWDAYGNPLGTTYQRDANTGAIILDTEGLPIIDEIPGEGFVLTPDANGELIIKNLVPAKYGIQVIPPAGSGWKQTSTIEGSRVIDAWVKSNEPSKFVEFGPPGWHVFVGFVREFDCIDPAQQDTEPCWLRDVDGILVDGDPDTPGTQTVPVLDPVAANSGATLSGTIRNNHMARPPNYAFADGELFEACRVALNLNLTGNTISSQACGPNADFRFENVPDGTYSLSIWDDGMNVVIANHPIILAENPSLAGEFNVHNLAPSFNGNRPAYPASGGNCVNDAGDAPGSNCVLGDIPVFDWFHYVDTVVFHDSDEDGRLDVTEDLNGNGELDLGLNEDANGNGQLDPGEDLNGNDVLDTNLDEVDLDGDGTLEIAEQTLNADAAVTILRFRDGRIYKEVPIDGEGAAPHEEVFPFFHWLVAEVDFGRYKATGATFVADGGGDGSNLQEDGYVPYAGEAPEVQEGAVLTKAFQGFLGQKNTMLFGKKDYADGENGGISGMAVYAITRAEDDPAFAATEPWEPGIPNVQFALYRVDQAPGAVGGAPGTDFTPPDVDNYPFGYRDGGAPGPEDEDWNGNGLFDFGNVYVLNADDADPTNDEPQVTWSDSFDASQPENCQGDNSFVDSLGNPLVDGNGVSVPADKCFDGLRNWNQVRDGLFDGGYAFPENLPAGEYVVQVFVPPGYELLGEDDKNVDFGDEYVPQLLPVPCVGEEVDVPRYLSFDGSTLSPPYEDAADPIVQRPLCDRKLIRVADGKNAAAEFHLLTQVPKAAQVVGGMIVDNANEFNPNSPNFGEKFAAPWLPVAFYDHAGREIQRVYSDQFGKFNAMLPSTYTVNVASPSGMAPNMVTACMNDAGEVANPNYDPTDPMSQPRIVDPRHNPQYSQFCYVFQYMPGGTTYLDTPVLQIAAFAGNSGKQLDCEYDAGVPMIHSVRADGDIGPYILQRSNPGQYQHLFIESVGERWVPNPAVNELSIDNLVPRDYSFGNDEGSVRLIPEARWNNGNIPAAIPLNVVNWSPTSIEAELEQRVGSGRYQLVVTRKYKDPLTDEDLLIDSEMSVTVTVGPASRVKRVYPSTAPDATPIQDMLDIANRGDTILVAKGVYNETVIMHNPVYLQGAGPFATILNAISKPNEKVEAWRQRIINLHLNGDFELLPWQEAGTAPDFVELFPGQEAAGLTVVGLGPSFNPNSNTFEYDRDRRTRGLSRSRSGIDGFNIVGASTGGAIFVNAYIQGFTASNNRIEGNNGTYGGGIRFGYHNVLIAAEENDSQNDWNRVHHNMISRNGTFFGAGGGVSIYAGADNYWIRDNLVCGNLANTDGGGIGHLGLSNRGTIEDNLVIFNQSFRQTPGFETDGGGILVAGADGATTTELGLGAGSVDIERNLIQGNNSGAGDGAGIALRRVNGADIVESRRNNGTYARNQWYRIRIRNNTIANNVAGGTGGAISLVDSARVEIRNNTIANNESTATAGEAFQGSGTVSTPQVAGIASQAYRALMDIFQPGTGIPGRYRRAFPYPSLVNNILWHNRSRYYVLNDAAGNRVNELRDFADLSTWTPTNPNVSALPSYWDLGVVGAVGVLDPNYSVLSCLPGGPASCVTAPPYADGTNLEFGDETTSSRLFVRAHTNGSPFTDDALPEFTTIQTAPALDEGGNWIDVRYAPLSINDIDGAGTDSDYHLPTEDPASIAEDNGTGNRGGADIDGEPGVSGDAVDIGSDEV